jgi:hypothetical protein
MVTDNRKIISILIVIITLSSGIIRVDRQKPSLPAIMCCPIYPLPDFHNLRELPCPDRSVLPDTISHPQCE